MRLVLAAALLLAPAAFAQVPSAPDAPPMGDKEAPPATAGTTAKEAPPSGADAGMPSDVHTTPPPVTSQAPPTTAGDMAPADTKSKGRARPSSTAKKRPQG